jgi:peptidoglycan/xylan/chitin deacetylase (PgdA/CDA1 family)
MRILMYHDVVAETPQEIHSVSVEQFEAQMQWLHDAGYQIIGLEDWYAARRAGKSTPANTVAITFDDGFEDNYTRAWPILQQHGFTATIFLVTGALAATSVWRGGDLGRASMLSSQQILEMAEDGVTFGSHTVSHRRLAQLSDVAEIDRELVASKAVLEQLLQREVLSVCYPFSQVNPLIKARARAAGYQMGFTYAPGYVGAPGRDWLELRRTGILATDTVESFARKVRADASLRLRWGLRAFKQRLRRLVKGAA